MIGTVSAGGAGIFIGSFFGPVGCIVGGVIGAAIGGGAEIHKEHKRKEYEKEKLLNEKLRLQKKQQYALENHDSASVEKIRTDLNEINNRIKSLS